MGIDVTLGVLWAELATYRDQTLAEFGDRSRYVPLRKLRADRELSWSDRLSEEEWLFERIEFGLRTSSRIQGILSEIEGKIIRWREDAPKRPEDAFDDEEAFQIASDEAGKYIGR